jgi:TolA-binding protein
VPKRDSDRRTRVPRFVDRVIQRRRAEASADSPPGEPPGYGESADGDAELVEEPQKDFAARIATLEQRIEQLESLVEGLQDAMHRQTVRQDKEIGELERKTEAGEMTRSLDRHARERGL